MHTMAMQLVWTNEAKLIGAGLATIALGGVGVGIGLIFSNLLYAAAINPLAADKIFGYAVLGFALTEAIGLFALMVVFLMLFMF